MKPYVIQLIGDLKWSSLDTLVRQIQLCRIARGVFFDLDLQNVRFCHPSGIVCLAAGIRYLEAQGFHLISLKLPANSDVAFYLQRIGLFSDLGIPDVLEIRRRDATGRFVELVHLPAPAGDEEAKNAIETAVDQALGVITSNVSVSPDGQNMIWNVLTEVTENIFNHAESTLGGYVCSQTYPNNKEVHVTIADLGIGIEASLRRNPRNEKRINEAGAIRTALEKGVTARPENCGGGIGLFFSSQIIRQNRGNLGVYSRSEMYTQTPRSTTTESAPTWPGTIIDLKFKTDRPIKVSEFYGQDDIGTDLDGIFDAPI
jgi:anti-sigma regulatory factor (Ser/Thr protein kinase)